MSDIKSDVYLEKLEGILEKLEHKDDSEIRANNFMQEIKPHLVIDWYKKDSASAMIRSYLRRYLINKEYNGDTTELVNRIFQALLEVHKSENDKNIEFDSNDEIKINQYPEAESDSNLDISRYTIVLDTNFLYISYDDGGNFNQFTLNSNFNNLSLEIEKMGIYEYIKIGIPDVVWNELIVQKKSTFDQEINKIKDTIVKYEFPKSILDLEIDNNVYIDYEKILKQQFKEYSKKLNKPGNVKIVNLPFENCSLEKISTRAFRKKPPFEGKNKRSDKGFKDALIWESIIEYKKQNMKENIVYLTNDKAFNSLLISEFKEMFDEEIYIVNIKEKNAILERIGLQIMSEIGESLRIEFEPDSIILDEFYEWTITDDFEDELESVIREDLNDNQTYIKSLDLVDHKMIENIEFKSDESLIFYIDCTLSLEFNSKNEKDIEIEKELIIEAFMKSEGFNLSILDM
jgi:hypothetical protein